MGRIEDPKEKKDADSRNAFCRSYTLMHHVQEQWDDERLAQALKLMKEVFDEIVPDPHVANPKGRWTAPSR